MCDAEPLLLCHTWRLWKSLRSPLHNHSGLSQGCLAKTGLGENTERTRRHDWSLVSLRWRKSLSQSKTQTRRGRDTFLTSLFTDSWNVLKPWLLPVCQQRTQQDAFLLTSSCPFKFSPYFYYMPFLFHSFAGWGWGNLNSEATYSSCRAVVVALIKNPNWNKGQPAEALQPRLHGEKEKRNTSSYFSLH